MSKASRYADIWKMACEEQPEPFLDRNKVLIADVKPSGSLRLYPAELSQSEALRLRDWLTENFGD